jgi:hypothetical protein
MAITFLFLVFGVAKGGRGKQRLRCPLLVVFGRIQRIRNQGKEEKTGERRDYVLAKE